MKKLLLIALTMIVVGQASAQWTTLIPSKHLYYSTGITKSLSNYTGNLGAHYVFDNGFGVSLQTNFVRDLGWYIDLLPMKQTLFNPCISIGYSPVYNSVSYSLNICIQAREFSFW